MRFPFFKQQDAMDCGPTCLRMVAKHYGKNIAIQELRKLAEVSKEGVSKAEAEELKTKLSEAGAEVEIA